MDEDRKLDLDELFGKNRTITILWGGKEHHLRGLTALGPAELAGWGALEKRYKKMMVAFSRDERTELTVEQAKQVIDLIDRIMALIAEPELVNDMALGFIHKSKILEYYMQESGVLQKNAGGTFQGKKRLG